MNPESRPCDSRHASLIRNFIQSKKNEGYRPIGCEILYNYFGDRGVVDVVLRKDDPVNARAVWLVCEIKPVLFDIGETIRQVHRTQEYFCLSRPDMSVEGWNNVYRFALVMNSCDENYSLLERYRDLFSGIDLIFQNEDIVIPQSDYSLTEIREAILKVICNSPGA